MFEYVSQNQHSPRYEDEVVRLVDFACCLTGTCIKALDRITPYAAPSDIYSRIVIRIHIFLSPEVYL